MEIRKKNAEGFFFLRKLNKLKIFLKVLYIAISDLVIFKMRRYLSTQVAKEALKRRKAGLKVAQWPDLA